MYYQYNIGDLTRAVYYYFKKSIMTEKEYMDIRNLGLLVAAQEALEEILVIDENEIIKWEDLKNLKGRLQLWRDKLHKKHLTDRKNEIRESNHNTELSEYYK